MNLKSLDCVTTTGKLKYLVISGTNGHLAIPAMLKMKYSCEKAVEFAFQAKEHLLL
jgi:hypothetical protein